MSNPTAPSDAGVIGAGAMGMGVVARLLGHGRAVTVCDIDPAARADALARGARIAATPRDLASEACMIVVLVVDASQFEHVLCGPSGLLPALTADHVVLACSTIAPADVARFGALVRGTGAALVDAPVSGGPARAHDGTMSMMIAGDDATLERCAPLVATMAGKVFRVGSTPGDGARFKVINNMLAGINLAAAAEAMALAAKVGLDPRLVFDVVHASSGASWIFADRMQRALDGDYAPRAAARILTKDVGLAVDLAASAQMAAPLARAARAAFAATVAAGLGDEDDAAIYKWHRQQAGLPDA